MTTHDQLDASFLKFWAIYPRHSSRKDAFRVWCRLDPNEALQAMIVEALGWQCRQEQWTKDGGKFIPEAARWLRGEKWSDEKPKTTPPTLTRFASLGMHRENK